MQKQSFYSKLAKDEKYIIICCFFVFAVNGLYGMILGSLLPLISAEYHLTDTMSGTLLSAHSVGNLVSGFLAGILPVYLGRKKSIMFLCSFVTIGFLLMILTGNPGILVLAFLFTGISRGSISNFNNGMVNEVSDSSPSALSFLHSIFAVGALLAPYLVIVSVKLLGNEGWKLSAAVIILLTLISNFLFSKMKIKEKNKTKENEGKKEISYEFLKLKVFWINAGILFFYLCAESAINGFMVKYFVDTKIMSLGYAQVLASLLWIAILIGRLFITYLGDRLPKHMIQLVTTISTTAFYMLLLSSRDQTTITIAIFGVGLSMAGIYPTTVSSVGQILKVYPMAMGVLLVLGGVGAIVMPILTGALSDKLGIMAGMSAIIVALILMITFTVLSVIHLANERKSKMTA